MQEIKIPDGHKATILGGTIRIEPIEKKCEFKRGDIVYKDKSIHIHDSVGINGENHCFASLYLDSGNLFVSVKGREYGGYIYDIDSFATLSEQQLLFDALAKEGKYWDAEALEVKDLIKVPESIGIYKWFGEEEDDKCGDNLFIGFNNDTQILGYDDTNKCYLVYPKRNDWQEVECYLQPCKREDLKAGDTAFISKADYFDNLDMYYKMIDISEYGFARASGNDIKMVGIKTDLDIRYFKLITINK